MAQTPLTPLNAIQQPWRDPKALGERARAVFDPSIRVLEQAAAADAVNMPDRPEPVANPFANPMVQLGMALQGRSSEAIAAATQIEQVNKRRMDQYRQQLQQAENYRQLRQQRIRTSLAEIQAQAARAELGAVEGERARQDEARADFADRQLTQQQLGLMEEQVDIAKATEARLKAQQERQKTFSEYMQQNPELAQRVASLRSSLVDGVITLGVPSKEDPTKLVSQTYNLNDPSMPLATKETAMQHYVSEARTIAYVLETSGFDQEAADLLQKIDAMVEANSSFNRDMDEKGDALLGPETQKAARVEAGLPAEGETPPVGFDLDVTTSEDAARVIAAMSNELQNVDLPAEQLGEFVRGERTEVDWPLAQKIEQRVQLALMDQEREEFNSPAYFSKRNPPGRRRLEAAASELAQTLRQTQPALSADEIRERVKEILNKNHGVPKGHLKDLDIGGLEHRGRGRAFASGLKALF